MSAPGTLGAVLGAARRAGIPRLDAELLAGMVCGLERSAVIAHPERELDEREQRRLGELLQRRAEGVPLAQLRGRREFFDLDLLVTPEVLIPRPETELLVETVLDATPDIARRVVDLGTGSGAIILALAARRRHWTLWAVDLSPDALAVARQNGERLAPGRVHWTLGDWFAPLGETRFDVIVSNPPYVGDEDPDLAGDVLRHEPALALFAGPDGLTALRQIIAGAPAQLSTDGLLVLEHGHRQGDAVRALLEARGFDAIETRADLEGRPRVTAARWPRGAAPHG
ncbi:MAG: peptide chain release factor N(5)-glutamine methyltransferase [Pseudomonadales bacterium]|jgi:release factor glutamine methyltransferase|nr:peptide chain release factor N(5)-glutamine methyltransferase [Pseudomonadales bacterium]